jgi:hypothetical protein
MLLTSMYSCQVHQHYYISYGTCGSSLGIVNGLQAGMWDRGSILGRGKIFVPSLKHSVALGPSQPPGCQRLLSWVLSSSWGNLTGHFCSSGVKNVWTWPNFHSFTSLHDLALSIIVVQEKVFLRTCPNVTMQLNPLNPELNPIC